MGKKIIHNKSEAMEFLREYLNASNKKLKIGVAGSFACDEQTVDSDLDIVVDTFDEVTFDLDIHKSLDQYCSDHLACAYDILWIKDLKQQDERYDQLLLENNLEINKVSAYKNIKNEVKWLE